MNLPSNTKIEDRAIGALKNVVDDDLTMMAQFYSMDKEMAWDGYILIFKKNNGDQRKSNIDDKVPVQIKGHIDEKAKFINKEIINFPVDLVDLDIYFNDRGVVYFSIFMSNDGKRREVFYSSLYPSKIKSILERARNKGNKESINIAFRKMKKEPQELYVILKQFSRESKAQGFGTGEIVQNTISLDARERLTSITATAIGAKNDFEFLQRIATGDVCFYGTIDGSKINLPLEWSDKSKFLIRKEIEQKIIVDNEVYYEHYLISMSSDKDFVFFFSDNLRIDCTKGKFHFEPKTRIGQVRKDAEFLLAFIENEVLWFDDHECRYNIINVSEEFIQSLRFFVDLDNTLKEICFDYDIPHALWTEEVREQMVRLVEMKKGNYNYMFAEKVHIYNWEIDGKFLPIAVIRHNLDEENNMINSVITRSLRTSVADKQGNYYIVPAFAFIDWNVIKKLYKYDYNYFYEQIDGADINEYTTNELNHAALKLITAFDDSEDKKLLEIASYCLDKIYDLEKDKEYYQANLFQIKKRLGLMDEKDINLIMLWDLQEPEILFAKNVLLDDKISAKKYWKDIDKTSKELIKDYPIYTLYSKLCSNG